MRRGNICGTRTQGRFGPHAPAKSTAGLSDGTPLGFGFGRAVSVHSYSLISSHDFRRPALAAPVRQFSPASSTIFQVSLAFFPMNPANIDMWGQVPRRLYAGVLDGILS